MENQYEHWVSAEYRNPEETEVLVTLADGGTLTAPAGHRGLNHLTVGAFVASTPVYDVISKHQMIKQMKVQNKVADAKAAYATWASDSDAALEWEMATEIRKDGALIAQLKSDLSFTDQQVDNFFNAAGEL